MCPLVVNTVWAERLGGSSEPHTVAQPLFASHHREVRARTPCSWSALEQDGHWERPIAGWFLRCCLADAALTSGPLQCLSRL